MTDPEDEPTESDSPATWENVVVGRAKEAIGHVIGNDELEEEGEEQAEVAHEVHEEVKDEHRG
ncbi:MAG TPA: hypothetical protein VKB75_11355 [Jatrophihabitans sp.]|nr:hypothetical protein [Jatrophihabitans sp.]